MAILTKRRAKDAPAQAQTGKRTTAQTPAERLTSAIKGEAVATPRLGGRTTVTPAQAPTAAKPAITRPGGPTTITNRVSGAARPSVSTTQNSAGSTSGLTNAITGALSGAAIGVGAKAVYDKLTGTVKKVPAATPASGSGSRTMGSSGSSGSSGTGLKIPPVGSSGTGLKVPGAGTGTGLKLPGGTTGGRTPPFAPPGTNTSGGATGPKTGTGASGFPISQGKPVRPGTGASGFPVKDSDESSSGASGFPVTTDGEGNQTYTYDDGSTVTLDADGNIVSYTEATDPFAADSTNIALDDSGNTVYTYDDGSTFTIDADGNVVATTEANSDGTGASDFPVNENLYADGESGSGASGFPVNDVLTDSGYYQDDQGNIFDSNGYLIYAADDSYYDDYSDQQIADYIYTDEDGNKYDYYGNLVAEANYADGSYNYDDSYYDDSYYDDRYAYNDQDDNYYSEQDYAYLDDDYYDYEDDYFAKKGGLVALMKEGGGVRRFVDGGYSDTDEEVQDWQNVSSNYDGSDWMAGQYALNYGGGSGSTYSGAPLERVSLSNSPVVAAASPDSGSDAEYFDDGSYIIYYADGSSITYDSTGAVYQANENGLINSMAGAVIDRQTVNTSGSDATDYNRYSTGNIQYFDDGSYIQTFDDGSTLTVDSDGKVYGSTPATDYSVSSAGSGSGRTQYYGGGETPAERARRLAEEAKQAAGQKSAISEIMDKVTGSGYLGAGAAGAVLGALLGNSDLFSGGTGTQNKGIDMSKVGVIPARTTDFGVGPANYVTYDQYGARDQMPDIYGDELYRNLNAPGFNPVNEGEYGAETPSPDTAEQQPAPAMADGGLAGSYYTFGKSVDPIQNLTNPRPTQQTQAPQMAQAGGLPRAGGLPNSPAMGTPQQPSAQQQMPQQVQMPPGMKGGGLPALSNVPLAEGRLDFRQGSAVHGPGDGQSDDIPAMLADGEYVIDAETVAQIGNGSTKAGAKALDEFRQNIRKHKRSAPLDKIPPKTKTLTSYLKKGK